MIRFTLTIGEPVLTLLRRGLARAPKRPLLFSCALSITSSEIRVLAREAAPAAALAAAGAAIPKIAAGSDQVQAFFFPMSGVDPAAVDPAVRPSFVRLVFKDQQLVDAAAWFVSGESAVLDCVRFIGSAFSFWHQPAADERVAAYDRQIRAYGSSVQQWLQRLKIGIVGAGGTGSAVAEQLIRLGAHSLLVVDDDCLEDTNLSRVYGSRQSDVGTAKVDLVARSAAEINSRCAVSAITGRATDLAVVGELKSCDLLFGCTDDHWGRAILSRLAVYYAIPVFDTGVLVQPSAVGSPSVFARVTLLAPGAACLFCRGRISPTAVRADVERRLNPQEAGWLEQTGYIDGTVDPAPAVIPYTAIAAASAVAELLHRMAGGTPRRTFAGELIHLPHAGITKQVVARPQPDCFCGAAELQNQGDVVPLLDTLWPPT